MRLLDTRQQSRAEVLHALTATHRHALPDVEAGARVILDDVRARGDAAVLDWVERLDGCRPASLEVPVDELRAAEAAADPAYLAALDRAVANVDRYHRAALPRSWEIAVDGARLGQVIRPLERVGVLVPAGKAPLPSSLVMAAVPARAAGVPEIFACASPRRDGTVDPAILTAAARVGVDRFFRMGAAQAVAAYAFGTESVPRVDKIVGPGGPYTVTAKRLVFGRVGIESLPGPTEVLIIADAIANPAWVAADLLSQAEHGEDSLVALLTPDRDLAAAVVAEVGRQAELLSRRETLHACLAAHGYAVVTRDLEEACELSNACAPEHLELVVADPERWLPQIRHAGAIMIGEHTPEPVGDYLAGPSHILPTAGTARFSSPLSVDDFLKRSSVLRYSRARLERDAQQVVRLAEAEGLDAHAAAVRVRLAAPGDSLNRGG